MILLLKVVLLFWILIGHRSFPESEEWNTLACLHSWRGTRHQKSVGIELIEQEPWYSG